MSNFLLEKGFPKGKVDITLFIKKSNHDLLIVQIYIDDIIFGATNHCLCDEFWVLAMQEELINLKETKFGPWFLDLNIILL